MVWNHLEIDIKLAKAKILFDLGRKVCRLPGAIRSCRSSTALFVDFNYIYVFSVYTKLKNKKRREVKHHRSTEVSWQQTQHTVWWTSHFVVHYWWCCSSRLSPVDCQLERSRSDEKIKDNLSEIFRARGRGKLSRWLFRSICCINFLSKLVAKPVRFAALRFEMQHVCKGGWWSNYEFKEKIFSALKFSTALTVAAKVW